MLYRPEYCIASVGAMIILLIMFFMKRNYALRSNRIFFVMLLDNLLASGLNIVTFYTISFPERFPLWFCYLSNQLYLFVYNFMAVLFLLYVDSKTKIGSVKKVITVIATLIVAFDAIIIFGTHQTHLVVYYDENLVYRHGPMMLALYVSAFLSVAIADVVFIAKYKMFNFYQVLSVNLFAGGVFAAVIFQMFFPRYAITNYACAMILFFVYVAFENQAYYLHGDTLCYNRRAFIKTINQKRFRKEEYLMAVIRLNSFENIRNSLGKMGVEDLVEKIAERISRAYGKGAYYVDLNCFTVIRQPSVDKEQLKKGIRECFLQTFQMEVGDDTISVEVEPIVTLVRVCGEHFDGAEMTDLLQKATTSFDDPTIELEDADDLVKPIRREKEVLGLIDRAIKHDGFMVWYQPIYDVKADAFTCSEALIRLKDDSQGYVGPEEFIPVAERNGRIRDIGDYVFRDVCRFIKTNKILSRGVHYIEINLSPEQCNRVELANQLIDIATEYGVDFRQINLEITETAEMQSCGMHNVNQLITDLHDKGVTFALDDFGSGFAAIDYLIKLPVDIVKIDKGILWQAMEDASSMKILKNTIHMIREVGKKIVVEGIETPEMAELLIENGCDYLQGYLYSRPLPEERYLLFLEERNKRRAAGKVAK
ncbi:MAG: EAL domain-containing protein [Lachnospiraceae bacterium]|nr:EAL domain-containing protein [Lachnospiraceae bacterium]